jgi:predicted glycosyltransferase
MMRRMVPDLGHEMRTASGSVSQCGYNTAMDLLDSRVPALVVPSGANEDEQVKRARRLEALGAVRVLPATDLTAPRLAAEIAALASFTPTASRLNMSGAERTTQLIDAMLEHNDAAAGNAAMLPPMEQTA